MTFVSQALEWVRALLLGLCKPGTHSRACMAYPRPVDLAPAPACVAQPPAETWGALLVLARLRRAGRVPLPPDLQRPQDETGVFVRAYVLSAVEVQQVLWAGKFAGASR